MQTRTSERKGERFSSQRQEEGRSLLALSMKMLLSLPSLSPFTPLLAFLSFESCSHALFNQERRQRERRHEWSRDGEERLQEGRRVQGSREERQEAKRRRRLIGSIDEANERSNSSLW